MLFFLGSLNMEAAKRPMATLEEIQASIDQVVQSVYRLEGCTNLASIERVRRKQKEILFTDFCHTENVEEEVWSDKAETKLHVFWKDNTAHHPESTILI